MLTILKMMEVKPVYPIYEAFQYTGENEKDVGLFCERHGIDLATGEKSFFGKCTVSFKCWATSLNKDDYILVCETKEGKSVEVYKEKYVKKFFQIIKEFEA